MIREKIDLIEKGLRTPTGLFLHRGMLGGVLGGLLVFFAVVYWSVGLAVGVLFLMSELLNRKEKHRGYDTGSDPAVFRPRTKNEFRI